MTGTETVISSSSDSPPELVWTAKKEWGSEGRTYRAKGAAGGREWSFVIDQPRKGQWVLRAWADGTFTLYREAPTMKALKEQAADAWRQAHALSVSLAETEARGESVPVAAAASAVAASPAPRRTATTAIAMLKWRTARQCACPTPLHTMRCGHGGIAVPVGGAA